MDFLENNNYSISYINNRIEQENLSKFIPWWLKLFFVKPSSFKLIYLPFLYYHKLKYNVDFDGKGGESYWDTETYTEWENINGHHIPKTRTRSVRKIRWYNVKRAFTNYFYDLTICVSKIISKNIKVNLSYWGEWSFLTVQQVNMEDLKNKSDVDLSFLNINPDSYNLELEKIIKYLIENSIFNKIEEIGRIEIDVTFNVYKINGYEYAYDNKYNIIFLPLWLSGYDPVSKKYLFAINGQNGSFFFDSPVLLKILLFTFFGSISVFLNWLVIFKTPYIMKLIKFILGIIGVFLTLFINFFVP